MWWIYDLLNFVYITCLLFFVIYVLYRVDKVNHDLGIKVANMEARFTRLIDAINSVNLSEYNLDKAQQRQIDNLRK